MTHVYGFTSNMKIARKKSKMEKKKGELVFGNVFVSEKRKQMKKMKRKKREEEKRLHKKETKGSKYNTIRQTG